MTQRLRVLALVVAVGLALGGHAGRSPSGQPDAAAEAVAPAATEPTMTRPGPRTEPMGGLGEEPPERAVGDGVLPRVRRPRRLGAGR